MKKYTLQIWLVGQNLSDPPFVNDSVEADSPEEALRNVSGAMRNPEAVLTLGPLRGDWQTVIPGSKILVAHAMEQVKVV